MSSRGAVRAELARRLRCPACLAEATLIVVSAAQNAREIDEGMLRCGSCEKEFAVHRGVIDLLFEPPAHIVAEAAGLARFAEVMRRDGWDRDRILRLPDIEDGYWWSQKCSIEELLATVDFQPGEVLLDIGANTCWASNVFARRGLDVIALDIATVELQGLHTAEFFLETGEVYFERVLGSMAALPFASSSIDYVYCCQVLHHNDPSSLRRTFQEIARVLRPGGRLLMVNETLRTLRDPRGVHDEEVQDFDGYEHAHWAMRYRWEARRAGFSTKVTEPKSRPFFNDEGSVRASFKGRPLGRVARRLVTAARPVPLIRRCYLLWLNHVWGGVSMNMIGVESARAGGVKARDRP